MHWWDDCVEGVKNYMGKCCTNQGARFACEAVRETRLMEAGSVAGGIECVSESAVER